MIDSRVKICNNVVIGGNVICISVIVGSSVLDSDALGSSACRCSANSAYVDRANAHSPRGINFGR